MNFLIEIGLNASNGPSLVHYDSLLWPQIQVLQCEDVMPINPDDHSPFFKLYVGKNNCFSYQKKADRDDEYKRLRLLIIDQASELQRRRDNPPVKKTFLRAFFQKVFGGY